MSRTVSRSVILLMLGMTLIWSISLNTTAQVRFEMEEVIGPPPSGWVHRPILEFFTGLSCPSCMGSDENAASPEKAVHEAYLRSIEDPEVPFTTVVFHELNGGGVDDLNDQEATDRMRFYQPGLSGTPDVEFDGGYVELGGFSTSTRDINEQNIDWAITESEQRHDNAPIRPLDRATWSFPYIRLEVDQVFLDGQFSVVGKVTYDGNAKLIGAPQLQGSLYVFMVEDNVEAYSTVYDKFVINDAVFRGYALEDEAFSLRNGATWEFSVSWPIPDLKVPIKPQDIHAVAAVYDTLDTTSAASASDGNMKAGSPRCLQSATSDSTAYDRENDPPVITDVKLSEDNIVTVTFSDAGGIANAVLFYNTGSINSTDWEFVPLQLVGEEICDEQGVCYAYSDPTGSVKLEPFDGQLFAQVLANDDQMAQSRSALFTLGEASSSNKDKGSSGLGGLEGSGLLIVGLIVIVGGVVLFLISRKKQGSIFKFFGYKGTLSVLIFIGLIVTFIGGAGMLTKEVTTVPEFEVTDTSGSVHTPGTYEGKVLVIDIMFTTCSICNDEMPDYVELVKSIKNEHGNDVFFLSVSVDKKDTSEMMDQFQDRFGADWPIAKDTSFIEKFDALEVPKKVVVAPNGDIVYQHKGYTDGDELKEAVRDAKEGTYKTSAISQSGGSLIAIGLVASVFGVMTFFSPCSFPMLPGYFTYYITNQAKQIGGKKKNPLTGGVLAATGIVSFFVLIGILVAIFGVAVQSLLRYLMPVIGAILLAFGILTLLGKDLFLERFMDLVKYPFQRISTAIKGNRQTGSSGSGGLFAYGFGYGAAASSCMAPVFLGVIFLGFASGGLLGALVVFGLYAISIGSMMIIFSYIAATGGKGIQKLISSTEMIKRISGLLLMFAGAFVLWYYFFGSSILGSFLSF
ncbi:MAG: cytochrome c biogenesis protein [Candidatus Thermoplasmatota archaeon]|nr:cytochrome c biogenesis protein [Candidatus Thermoplasmatota archaeon]